MQSLPEVRAIVFDVGETLVDESRAWMEQARRAGVTPFSLMGTIGGLIASGRDHREVWDVLGVEAPEWSPAIEAGDLYPDALTCLRAARRGGYLVGIAGNQPAAVESQLALAGFEADFIASSARWSASKPSSAFFERVVEQSGVGPDRILYTGDRLDNDVLPARAAGMRTAFIRRGPWGCIHSQRADVDLADLRLESLRELEGLIVSAPVPR